MEVNSDNKEQPIFKKRGRGRKPNKEEQIKTPKKRGRKPKLQNNDNSKNIEKTPKKRGRKPQSKIYSVNKNSNSEIQTNLNSNLILHLRINSELIEKKIFSKEFIEDKLLEYTPGISDPKPFDPNNVYYSTDDNKCGINNLERYEPVSFNEKKEDLNNLLSNLDIKTKERRIYTTMQQFIDEWPNSTDINCFWCCHKFESTPCSIPESLTNDLFKVKGCFCSFNCATAYLFSKESNKNSIWEKYSILHLLRNKLMKINDNSIIKPAPPREALKSFGGYLTINEFRNNFDKVYSISSPPIVILCPQIDQSTYGNEIKTSNKKFIPVDQQKIKQADQSLRLKRNKPLPNQRLSLESLLTES